ncbi:acyltransferase domain-containing protein, partial [Streptomyces sp. NPDC052051]|uniref:acyltransferase domain-containing protein n=1 Tax=Streptomyces sp. NPDC052051 TaxID=3154649 RepID=UPI003413EEA3
MADHASGTKAGGHPSPGALSGDALLHTLRSLPVTGAHDPASRGGTVFVYPGQGTQWQGMAVDLLESSPVFREQFDACARALAPYVDWSPIEVLRGAPAAPPLERTDVTLPVLFAVMVSLTALWRSWGVEPDAATGHCMGEVVAAYVSGALSLDDTARVSAAWGLAIHEDLDGGGAVAAVALPAEAIAEYLTPWDGRLFVAAVNGPTSVSVSGEPDAVVELVARCKADGIRARRIEVKFASHSPQVEAIRERLLRELAPVTSHASADSRTTYYSTTIAARPEPEALDAHFWFRTLREPVQLHQTVQVLLDAGHRTFVEVGAHPALTLGILDTIESAGLQDTALAVGSLRRGQDSLPTLLTSAADLRVHGVPVDWTAAFAQPGVAEAELSPDDLPRPPSSDDELSAYARSVRALAEPEGMAEVLRLVCELTMSVRGDTSPLNPELTFNNQGIDSPKAVQLRNRLVHETGQRLPATVVFSHPTPLALARHLHAELTGIDSASIDSGAHTPIASDEPIAIVGLGCRLPGGVGSPEELWRLVADGVDAVGEFPSDRGWDLEGLFDPDPEAVGTSSTRQGGFLSNAAGFDAEFFGISPREALAMDPQQRLLLETAWEALERAGLDPASLRGSRTGVYVGGTNLEYGPRMAEPIEAVNGYVLTGTTLSVASGRIAYTLGLEGPAVSVDTACSSSLVALHLAVQALRQGECDMALAGGVTIMSTPGMFVEFSRQGGLASDGRCKAFSADADGTGWSEGVGLLVVERLSDAQRLGHRVLAVVRGSAINQDGASNGLTAPNGAAQERVIRQALANAGLSPADVDVVEGHGTGTRLGDPIEAGALLATYGRQRDVERPLWLGSLKSNIGHTQSAAGVSGIIKMVMALRKQTLPVTLHADTPSPHVDWESGHVRLLTESRPWPEGETPRRAAVSSFGISGTNAHVIIEQAPVQPDFDAESDSGLPVTWTMSAKTPEALREQAVRLHEHLTARPDMEPVAVAAALERRTRFEHRGAVTGSTREELVDALHQLATVGEGPGVVTATASGVPARTAVLFTGQGSQRPGMGRELHAASPVFAAAFDEACQALDKHLTRPLAPIVFAEPGSPEAELLDQTEYTQPALFAVQVALFRLAEAHGLTPHALAGHSVGMLAAAHCAGVLSLPDAAHLVAARGRLMQQAPAGGVMIAVQAREEEVLTVLEQVGGDLTIAALNHPTSTVISGDAEAAEEAARILRGQGHKTRPLTVSHAFHSPHMDPVLADFEQAAAQVTFHAPTIPLVSDVTGTWTTPEQLADPAYWSQHIRSTVRYLDVTHTLQHTHITHYLEAGPDPVLTTLTQQTPGTEDTPWYGALLDRRHPEPEHTLTTLTQYALTADPQPTTHQLPNLPDLPTYPFQHHPYWLNPTHPNLTTAGLD